MDRIKSICIEEELCQSHDGSLEQILKQMLSYKKLYNVILRAEKGRHTILSRTGILSASLKKPIWEVKWKSNSRQIPLRY